MAKPKRGLGKGLGALIPQEIESVLSDAPVAAEDVEIISIDQITPNRNQPRKYFDPEKLAALETSVKEHGVLQPILITKIADEYQIVAGERRWRAAKNIGLKQIPVVVKNLSEKEVAEIALIENLQREDLNPVEEGMAYQSLIKEYDFRQEDVAKLVGKSRSYVTNTMRLLKLDEDTLEALNKKEITGGHGRALLAVEDLIKRKALLVQVIDEELSVREVEKLVSKLSKIIVAKPLRVKSDDVIALEDRISAHFGTKIKIKHGSKRGKIEIEYYGDDDLDRILNVMKIKA
ncbi:MAG: ParB/RepB/Spo0J family partition protein [Clostridia bacterium]|nr:ParB/RepB/Spo0J family partition protein [Clostridia bacterium]